MSIVAPWGGGAPSSLSTTFPTTFCCQGLIYWMASSPLPRWTLLGPLSWRHTSFHPLPQSYWTLRLFPQVRGSSPFMGGAPVGRRWGAHFWCLTWVWGRGVLQFLPRPRRIWRVGTVSTRTSSTYGFSEGKKTSSFISRHHGTKHHAC